MEPIKLVKQVFSFQKMLFENSFKTISMIQDQTGQMAANFVAMFPWMSDEGRKAVDESIRTWKNARDEFKKVVDESFSKFEEIFSKN